MKTDTEVQLMLRTRTKGKTLEQAAARAGMSVLKPTYKILLANLDWEPRSRRNRRQFGKR